MQSLRQSLWVFQLLVFSLVLTGCLDNSSTSKSNNQNEFEITLSLQFPETVENALVNAQSLDGEALTPTQLTNEQGQVILELSESHRNQPLVFKVQGGFQPETGHDFSGITLEFEQPAEATVSLDLLSYFDGTGEAETSSSDSKWQRSYFLASLLHTLKGTDNPVEELKQLLETSSSLETAITSLMAEHFDHEERWHQLSNLLELAKLKEASQADIKAKHLKLGLAQYLEERLHTSRLTAEQKSNLLQLSQQLLSSNNQRGLLPETPALLNLARALASQDILTLDALAEEAYQVDLKNLDIQALAANRLLDPRQPLAAAELLGMDEQKRRRYFLNSSLSPYNQLDAWTQDVLDDELQNEVQRRIAMGLASGGLVEEALQLVNTRIYRPSQQAQALRRVGNLAGQQGQKEKALEILDRALEIHTEDLKESKGILNLDPDDASFYQTLFGNFLALEEQERADAALATVNEFIESREGQPYDTAWGRIMTGTWRIAEAAVEEAEASGLKAATVEQARLSIDLFKRFTDQSGPMLDNDGNPRDRICHSVQTMNVVRYTNFYADLELDSQAEAGIEEFERLAQVPCNYISHGANLRTIAEAYTRLGLAERYRDFVENQLNFTVDDNESRREGNKENALAAIALAEEVEKIRANPTTEVITEAIAVIAPESVSLNNRLEQMTYLGQNKNTPYLALSLIRADQPEAARQVLDAAWELATSEDYLNEYATDPLRLVHWGCSKVAELYQEIDDLPTAQSKMQSCKQAAESQLNQQTTNQQSLTLMHLARGFHRLQLLDESLQQADQHQLLAETRSEAKDRINNLQTSAELFTQVDREDRAEEALNKAQIEINRLPTTTDDELKNKISSLNVQARGHHAIIQQVRQLPRVTQLDPTEIQLLERQASRILSRIQAGVELTQQLANATDRASYSHDLQDYLIRAGHLQEAGDLARQHSQEAVRIAALKRAAREVGNLDAFPGTQIARYDFDGDGRPDFFSPLSTAEEIQNSGLVLDDDIDGDGVLDTQDTRPYCPNC